MSEVLEMDSEIDGGADLTESRLTRRGSVDRFRLPDTLPLPLVQVVADRLTYSVEGIGGIRIDTEPPELVVTHEGGRSTEKLAELVGELVDESMRTRLRGSRVIRRTGPDDPRQVPDHPRPRRVDPDDAATARSVLHRAFDLMFLDVGREFAAAERRYPALIELEVMDRCRYIALFPQNAYLVDEFPHQRDLLGRMRDGTAHPEQLRRPSRFMLNPALCFHVYAEFQGNRLDGTTVLTTTGECFRHEAPWRLDAFRLPSFTMREIPFLGPAADVDLLRDSLLERVWELFVGLGFQGRVETATDPFYYSEDSAIRQHQLLANVKYELVADRPGGGTAAIASFNNVGDSLCRQFEVVDPQGRPAHSGCAAFGIDRWAELTLEHHGWQRERWPALLRHYCR
ncbi:hypothetical protein GCM10022225_07660 [Plantactinospora mayteni]